MCGVCVGGGGDTKSIFAAADQLSQTTSGISRALTEEGQIFLEHARQIIRSVETAEEQIAQRREIPSGRLRVNAATPAGG